MFDIAWSEMLVIGAVALVVIGPKDLPKALRAVGEAVGKVRRMASEFQNQFNDAMREAELHEIKKQVEDVGGSVQAATKVDFNPIQTIRDEIKGATAATAATTAAATTSAADPLPAPLPDPVVPLPDIPPPVTTADIIAQTAPPAPEPVEEPKPARKRKAKAADADGGAA